MEIFTNLQAAAQFLKARHSTLTIGNFDGCHLGHQKLATLTVSAAKSSSCLGGVLTFVPRPVEYFKQLQIADQMTGQTATEPAEDRCADLFSEAQKSRALAELGLDFHVRQTFDDTFSSLTARQFYHDCLLGNLKTKQIVLGSNFRFGSGRTGNSASLQDLGRSDDVEVRIEAPVSDSVGAISSSRIRQLLSELGDATKARALLGRPYLLEGKVCRGKQLGRTLGFPTANLSITEQLIPANGVYAAFGSVNEHGAKDRPAILSLQSRDLLPVALNIGVQPTVGSGHSRKVEAHFIDQSYSFDAFDGKDLGIYLIDRLRSELRFANLDHLKLQIAEDINRCRQVLSSTSKAL